MGLCHGAELLLVPARCGQALLATGAHKGWPWDKLWHGRSLLGSADSVLLLQKKDFPSHSFYVVVVVKTEDEACGGALPFYPLSKDASPGLQWGCHRGLSVWGQAGDRAES